MMHGINEDNRRWWLLAEMGGVLILAILDETIFGVALPSSTRLASLFSVPFICSTA